MSYPRTPTTTTSAATTTPNATPNEHYDASPATPTVWATPSVSTPSKPHSSPNPSSLTAIFDAGDDTSANVVLLSDAPTHVTARGQSHRRDREAAVPEIGDEVAVARALRHLADQLLESAAQHIEAVTGEDVVLRPS